MVASASVPSRWGTRTGSFTCCGLRHNSVEFRDGTATCPACGRDHTYEPTTPRPLPTPVPPSGVSRDASGGDGWFVLVPLVFVVAAFIFGFLIGRSSP